MIKINSGLRDQTEFSLLTVFKHLYKENDYYFTIEKRIKDEFGDFSCVVVALSKEEFCKVAAMIGSEFDKENIIDEFKVNKEEDLNDKI